MPEEINVGRLVAEIILESQTSGADEAISKINEVNNVAKDSKVTLGVDVKHQEDLIYIREVLEKIGIKGAEADKILENAFKDTSGLRKYKDNIEALSKKLDEQREKIEDLQSWSSKSSVPNIGLSNDALDEEIEKLKKLEDEFDQAFASQDDWVVKQVKNFQKQEKAVDSAAEKQEKLNQKMSDQKGRSNLNTAVRTLTTSLRTADSVIPDLIDNMDLLTTQITSIKESLSGGNKASKALSVLSAGIAGIGVVISLVCSYIEKYNKHKEEITEQALEAAEAVEQEKKALTEYRTQLAEIDKSQKSNDLTYEGSIENRKKLMEIQNELIERYGDEAAAIDFVTASINNQTDAVNSLEIANSSDFLTSNVEKVRDVKDYFSKNQNLEFDLLKYVNRYNGSSEEYLKAIGRAAKNANWTVTEGANAAFGNAYSVPISIKLEEVDPSEVQEAYRNLLKEVNKEFENLPDDVEAVKNTDFFSGVFTKNISDKYNDFSKTYKDNLDIYKQAITAEIQTSEQLSETYFKARDAKEAYNEAVVDNDYEGQITAIDNLKTLKVEYDANKTAVEGSEYVFKDLFGVLETFNPVQAQAAATAAEMTKKTEELNTVTQENISALGEAQSAYQALSGGQSLSADSLAALAEKYPELQEYIIKTGDLSLQNGEYLKQVADEAAQSNMRQIDSEKWKLTQKGEMTEEEKKYYKQLELSEQMYQAQLESLNNSDLSGLTSSLSSLGSAWSQLSQGKSLDFDTTLSLINQYPQFAQAMADGSISIENQAEVIKKLWEIKKQEAISSLELEKQKQLESGKTTQKIVDDIQKQITAYETEIQLRITMGAKESEYAATLQLVNDLKKQQGDLLQADKDKVAAIDAQIAAINGLTIETYNSTSAISDKNKALAEELKYMEHLKAIGQLTAEEELAWLQRINSTYAQNLDERYDMEKRLYNAEKAWREEQEKAIEDALQNEYKWIGYNKSLDSLSKQQELDWLLRIRDQYALNAEQAIELQIKIYEAEKALREEKLQAEYTAMNNQKSLDRLTSEQELEWLERIRATFELNAEQRMELEIKIHNLKKQLADEEESALEKAYDEALDRIERRKRLSALSYDLEIAYLDEIRRKYKLTADDAADLEQRIRDLLTDKKEADISALDKLGDAVTDALKNKYEQQRELEEDLINQSIENWKKWEDETTAAIQGQIDALDKLDEAQESEDKRREYELKRQQVELKLAYEKDDYNRKQLQKELNRLDKEEAERLLKEERKAQKEALQQQLEDVKKQSQEQQDALQKELDAIGENYDKLTSSFNLRAETERTMLQSSQKQMIELIKSYAPEYDLAGQSIGESLYNGFYGKYKSIETMVTQIGNFVDSYQRDLARTANAAADNFWASRAEYEVQLNAKASQSAQPAKQDISLVVNFNEPVESPIQVRRQLETVVDNLAAEIRK